eukprot:5208346-Pleurochrysis_carterae.AAC.4
MEGEYTGHVKEGKMHGVGVCVYTDGSRYQGDWKAGLKNGRGTHSFASGDQFEGEWENGWMHGLGVYTWKIGDKYIGEVNYGRIHGFGTYTWRTNSKKEMRQSYVRLPIDLISTAIALGVRRPMEGGQDARARREAGSARQPLRGRVARGEAHPEREGQEQRLPQLAQRDRRLGQHAAAAEQGLRLRLAG